MELWNLAQVVQDDKEHDAFEDHFLKLARVVENRACECAVMGEREPHADGASGGFAKEFSVDEIAPTSPGVGEWRYQKGEVECLPYIELVALCTDIHEQKTNHETAMV